MAAVESLATVAPGHATDLKRVRALVGLFMVVALTTALGAPAWAAASAPEAALLTGRWAGQGRFLNAQFQATHGPVPIAVTIQPDRTLTGTLGVARIPPCQPRPQAGQGHVQYQARLDGPIWPPGTVADPGKQHLVLLITQAEGPRLDANFHLKAGFGIDLTMLVGHWPAQRVP